MTKSCEVVKALVLADKQRVVKKRFARVRAEYDMEFTNKANELESQHAISLAALEEAKRAARRTKARIAAHANNNSVRVERMMQHDREEEAALEEVAINNEAYFADITEINDIDADTDEYADLCAICLGKFDEEGFDGGHGAAGAAAAAAASRLHVTKCSHIFHHSCIFSAPVQMDKCPVCRVGDI